MTTGDTSRSPSLGGEQREGPTGREPGLPSEWWQFKRFEDMYVDVLNSRKAYFEAKGTEDEQRLFKIWESKSFELNKILIELMK